MSDEPFPKGGLSVQDSKFWRIAAVLMIAAVLYVGHGLHNGGNNSLPSLISTAHAGGVGVFNGRVYTTNQVGTEVRVWNIDGFGKPIYLFTVSTDRVPKSARPLSATAK
jgi:hypothetical protein